MARPPEVQRQSRFKRDPADYVDTTENQNRVRHREIVPRRGPRPRNNDFEQLLEQLEIHKRHLSKAEKGFQSELYEVLSGAYAVAGKMRDRHHLWFKFIEDPFWDKCNRKKPRPTDEHRDMLLWVLRYLFDVTSTTGPRYSRVHKYASTLRRFAEDKVSVDDVEEHLREKGSEYAFAAHDADDGEEDRDSEGGPHTRDEGGPKSPSRPASERPVAAPSSWSRGGPKRAAAMLKPVLLVEVSESQMSDVLAKSRGSIEYEHRAGSVPSGQPGWQRVVATRVHSSDD